MKCFNNQAKSARPLEIDGKLNGFSRRWDHRGTIPGTGEPFPKSAVIIHVDRCLVMLKTGPKSSVAFTGTLMSRLGGSFATLSVLGEASLVGELFQPKFKIALASRTMCSLCHQGHESQNE